MHYAKNLHLWFLYFQQILSLETSLHKDLTKPYDKAVRKRKCYAAKCQRGDQRLAIATECIGNDADTCYRERREAEELCPTKDCGHDQLKLQHTDFKKVSGLLKL